MYVLKDVTFIEKEFVLETSSERKIELKETQEP
jgi:hypothetical protein